MIAVQETEKRDIKNYWETRAPQVWYSNKQRGSLAWFNELEFQRYATYYEYLPAVAEFANHFGEKVLEIGVGVGTDLVQYARNGALVSGIDLTENAIELTRHNLQLKDLPYDLLRTGDAENLPFEGDTFDLVYSFGVLHHTPRTDEAIRQVHRVLQDEGKAIIMLYARGWKHYVKRIFIHGILLGKLFRYGYNKLVNQQTEVHGGSPLTYVFTKRQLRRMFGMFGDVEIKRYRMGEYFDYAPYKTRKVPTFVERLIHLLSLERLLGENFIIKAVKTPPKPRFSFWKT